MESVDYKKIWKVLMGRHGDTNIAYSKQITLQGVMLELESEEHNRMRKDNNNDVDSKTINILTSYYGNHRKFKDHKGPILSISTTQPPGCNFEVIPELMPAYSDVTAIKYGKMSEEEFTTNYAKKLNHLSINSNYLEYIEDGTIFLCWEKIGKFCHRHILAEFLNSFKEYGINYVVKELE